MSNDVMDDNDEYDPFADEYFNDDDENKSWSIPVVPPHIHVCNSKDSEINGERDETTERDGMEEEKVLSDNKDTHCSNEETSHMLDVMTSDDTDKPPRRKRSRFSDATVENINEDVLLSTAPVATSLDCLESSRSDHVDSVDHETSTRVDRTKDPEPNHVNGKDKSLVTPPHECDSSDTTKYLSRASHDTNSTPSSVPGTPQEKALWKSCWVYIRKFLKPYRQEGKIATDDDMLRLSKKLAQKVYVKEAKRGTVEMNKYNAKRAQGYVADFFKRYKKYPSDS